MLCDEKMDLNLLPGFIAIFDTKSVSAAAARLHLSQPGMSTILRRLRVQFDDRLFIKTATGMEPTARARELEEPIRRILELVEKQVLVSNVFDPATAVQDFRFSVSDIGEYIFLPAILAEFAEKAPNARLSSLPARRSEFERDLESGALDLAVGYFPEIRSSNIVETVITRHTFGCFVNQSHPLAGRCLTREEFSQMDLVMVQCEEKSHELLEAFFKENRLTPNISFRTAHFMSIPGVLARTGLMAILPTKENVKPYYVNLAQVFTSFELPSGSVKMYWHRIAHANAAHRWFRDLVMKRIKTLSSPDWEPDERLDFSNRKVLFRDREKLSGTNLVA